MMLENDQTISKFSVAEIQLFRAIQLYLDECDYISALTLAGAAEEILGKYCENRGKKSEFKRRTDNKILLYTTFFGQPSKNSVHKLRSPFSFARNAIKHFNDPTEEFLRIDFRKEARQIIERAIRNHARIGCSTNILITRFREKENQS